jgi:cytidyltransferase-like protein
VTARLVVEESLDDLRSGDMRFLQEASVHGPLHVRVPSDALVRQATGRTPRFPQAERLFLARSTRWVTRASIVDRPIVEELERLAAGGAAVAVRGTQAGRALRRAAVAAGVTCRVVPAARRSGFPVREPAPLPPARTRVLVTGCYDWLHSGHVRFFMDAAAFGALFVVVGSDRNVALLKGPGHPLQGEAERRYMVDSMRVVHTCLVSSGSGWMDAEPEVEHIRPTHYVVNEDGDQPEKREFCRTHGIEYVVLRRVPHPGLPARSSTDLRGF